MTWPEILIWISALIGGLLLIFLAVSFSLRGQQEYPDWAMKALEKFEREAEKDKSLTDLEKIIKYFPDAKIIREGNKTVIDLAGSSTEQTKHEG